MSRTVHRNLGDIPADWSREKKIQELLGIARIVSRRWRCLDKGQVCLDVSDLYQTAAMAIVQAVDDYNPSLGVQLGAYAMIRAQYAVRDCIRLSTHAKRRMKQQGQRVRWISFSQPVRNGSSETVSLEEYLCENGPCATLEEDVLDSLEASWERALLQGYILRLPSRERFVIERHLAGAPTTQIAREMQLGNTRTRDMLRNAIARMRRFHQSDQALAQYKERQACRSVPC